MFLTAQKLVAEHMRVQSMHACTTSQLLSNVVKPLALRFVAAKCYLLYRYTLTDHFALFRVSRVDAICEYADFTLGFT